MGRLDKHQERVKKIVGEIIGLHERVERTIEALRANCDAANAALDDENCYGDPEYWRLVAFSDGMIKLRLIIEQNFNYIETFVILGITRYVLELLIWFKLLSNDPTYSFMYIKQLTTDKRDHAREHLNKVRNEIKLFKELEKEEAKNIENIAIRGTTAISPDVILQTMNAVSEDIDRTARRRFSLYAEDAKTNGFGFQAYLLENKIVPKLEREIDELQAFKAKAISQMPSSAHAHKPWKWKEQAANAGLSEQFEFVYAYTSRLLHATPTSMTTNQKNLELNEIVIFLDFIYISFLDAIEMCDGLLDKGRSTN